MAGRHELIRIASNQTVANSYENEIQTYLDVKEDNYFHDDFYAGWKDNRIGGMRKAMNAREETNKKIQKNNFASFKKARMAELHRLMAEADAEQKKSLEKEYDSLMQSNSYVDFGKKMGVYDEYVRNIHISNSSDDKQQVNWTVNHIDTIIAQRFEMMQSLSYALSNGEQIAVPASRSKELFDKVLKGARNYREHKDDGVYMLDAGRAHYQDGLAFQEMRQYAHEAVGITQSYRDAMQALYDSPTFAQMRQYYIEKAEKEKDYDAKAAWESGTIESIMAYARMKGHIKRELDSSFLAQEGVGYIGDHSDQDDRDKKRMEYADNNNKMIIPALENLEKAEKEYAFLSQMANEFNQARSQNPNLLETLGKANNKDYLIKLPSHTKEIIQVSNTVAGLADLMIQEGAVTETAWEIGKYAAITGISIATFGVGTAGMVCGFALTGADVGLGFVGPVAKMQQRVAKSIFDDSDFNRAVSGIKNAHIIKQAKQIVTYQNKLMEQAQSRLLKIDQDDFDSALSYGKAHSSFENKQILEFVEEAREMALMPCDEFAKLYEKHKKEYAEFEKQSQGGTQTVETVMRTQELAREKLLFEAASSGNYFYCARMATELAKPNSELEGYLHCYNEKEGELLKKVNDMMTMRVAAEMEADCREALVNEWKKAGKEIPEEEDTNEMEDGGDYQFNFDWMDEESQSMIEKHGETLAQNSQKYEDADLDVSERVQQKNVRNS